MKRMAAVVGRSKRRRVAASADATVVAAGAAGAAGAAAIAAAAAAAATVAVVALTVDTGAAAAANSVVLSTLPEHTVRDHHQPVWLSTQLASAVRATFSGTPISTATYVAAEFPEGGNRPDSCPRTLTIDDASTLALNYSVRDGPRMNVTGTYVTGFSLSVVGARCRVTALPGVFLGVPRSAMGLAAPYGPPLAPRLDAVDAYLAGTPAVELDLHGQVTCEAGRVLPERTLVVASRDRPTGDGAPRLLLLLVEELLGCSFEATVTAEESTGNGEGEEEANGNEVGQEQGDVDEMAAEVDASGDEDDGGDGVDGPACFPAGAQVELSHGERIRMIASP